ncbi:FAD-dependent oxidoreductase [Chryseolinea lacunae]|uniref:FAD-dependent oxidoreductase n=1 Tax=Chryseolinea lacunae TaxID=2801331 RepID=A0ABS1KUL7_9BACT|nr:FAD-dependent oxidoreductase [Chryseolinea lacunae]MBL0742937.1 FAD-dependent oxidoreductase [Chryseolinea lacunae]
MTLPNLNTFAPNARPEALASKRAPAFAKGSSVVVVGAGAFGGWSALYLLRKGFQVTLVDAWGAGNSRSSSGDETRVIRSTYGANQTYFDLNVRALELWKENQARFDKKLFFNTGVLWFCYDEKTPLVDDSIAFARRHTMDYEYLTTQELNRRYPQIHTHDLHHAYLDPYGGYLKARESMQAVQTAVAEEGGHYIQAHVQPMPEQHGTLETLHLSNGDTLTADAFVFACGAWMGTMFPELLQRQVNCTKQEVYYFGAPARHAAAFEHLPVWIDVDGQDFYYGIPGNTHRGFKIGVDIRGDVFDPTHGDHTLTPEALTKARTFLAHRFPQLRDAPLSESRVCPYENSSDGNFIFDLHPETDNVFLLGGGSGHGFKHGPALGEQVAQTLAGERQLSEMFALKKTD